MKALEWHRFLEDQRDRHAKVLFTPTELANACGSGTASIRVALRRLVARGILRRYVNGRYGLPGAVQAGNLAPSIDPASYVTGMLALYRHRLVTQAPSEIRCFTNRRHNRSRARTTPLGRIVFVCVSKPVYQRPDTAPIAGPEQSLCDFVYDCRRRGLSPSDLVTFRNLGLLNGRKLDEHLLRYPATVARDIARLRASA